MYSLDPNTNTAVERQADRVRAVRAYGSREPSGQPAPLRAPDNSGRSHPVVAKVALALAATSPIVLLVAWGLMTR